VICSCICKGLSYQRYSDVLPLFILGAALAIGMSNTIKDWGIILMADVMIFFASCGSWMWLLLFTARLENIYFTPKLLRTIGGSKCSSGQALDIIQPYPWDVITYGSKTRGVFTPHDDNRFIVGFTTIRLGIYYVPQQYVVILAMLNPTVVGIVLLRNLLWVCIGILAVGMSTVFAVHLYKHLDDKKGLRRLMRVSARRLRSSPERVVFSPLLIQDNASPVRLQLSPQRLSPPSSVQIRRLATSQVKTRAQAKREN